jgi:hypothetical protein
VPVGADKAYDTANFVMEYREENITPHVTQNISRVRGWPIDARTTRHPGYAVSLRIRKRVEEGFGWMKEVAGLAQVKLRGLARVDTAFQLRLAAFNVVRLPKLLAARAAGGVCPECRTEVGCRHKPRCYAQRNRLNPTSRAQSALQARPANSTRRFFSSLLVSVTEPACSGQCANSPRMMGDTISSKGDACSAR